MITSEFLHNDQYMKMLYGFGLVIYQSCYRGQVMNFFYFFKFAPILKMKNILNCSIKIGNTGTCILADGICKQIKLLLITGGPLNDKLSSVIMTLLTIELILLFGTQVLFLLNTLFETQFSCHF